ncbi:DegT/DnrJ/EryC1/StrS family aminotransferase [Dactylosporangium vinaceum]
MRRQRLIGSAQLARSDSRPELLDGAPVMDEIAAFRVRFPAEVVEEFLRRAAAVLETGQLIPGTNNAEFELRFAELVGAEHAVTVSSGTAALEIALRVAAVEGRPVLVPANTNYATAEAVLRAGCRPVLYDAGLYPDLAAIGAAWTPEIAAVVVVHIGGYLTPELVRIRRWCDERDVLLIEDASHAHGAAVDGRRAGTFGHLAAFSLFATKVLTTAEGGVLTTGSGVRAAAARRYRDQGKADDGLHNVVFGSAWRMSELHAALGVAQLLGFEAILTRLDRLVSRYLDGIDHPAVLVPRLPGARCSGHKFIVTTSGAAARESLRAHLRACGVQPGKGVYDVPLHRQPALRLTDQGPFAAAEHFAASHVCLPLWHGLTDNEADRVVEAVNGWRYDG